MTIFDDFISQIDSIERSVDRLAAVEIPASTSGSTAPGDAQYLTLATDATLTNERVLLAGSGLTLTDGGAGACAVFDVDIGNGLEFSSGSIVAVTGSGLTLSASGISLTAPGTLNASTVNTASGNHLHTITTASDGETNIDTILQSSGSGDLTLRNLVLGGTLGVNTACPNEQVEVNGDILIRNPGNNGALIISPGISGYEVTADFLVQAAEAGGGTDALNFVLSRNAKWRTSDDSFQYIDTTGKIASIIRFSNAGDIVFGTAASGTGAVTFTEPFVVRFDGDVDVRNSAVLRLFSGDGSTETGRWDSATGRLGIGATSPSAAIEVADSSGSPHVRLSHTSGSNFVDFAVNDSSDLVITAASTGQVIIQPTEDSTDSFQVLDASGSPVLSTDTLNSGVSIKSVTTNYTFQGSSTQSGLFVETPDTSNVRSVAISRPSDTAARGPQQAFLRSSASGGTAADTYIVGSVNFEAHDGTDYNLGCQITAEIDGTVAANTVPMAFVVKTSETSSAGLIERFKVTPAGLVVIGTVSPSAQLHVDQTSTVAEIPALYLDQADVSEEMIEFNSTIGTGNALESVGAKSLTTTHFIKVTLPGTLTRYIPCGTIA